MPKIVDGKPELTADEERLVRGMNNAGRSGGIGALHFDGAVLRDMVDVFIRLNPPFPGYPHSRDI